MENITNFNLEELSKFDKIFCLVSGGIDSTYLYELIKERYPNKIYPTNCFNPYENSDTLEILRKEKNFIEVKPLKDLDYKLILQNAFLKIPKAIELKKDGKYHKNIFGCCNIIKHKAFLTIEWFKEKNTVVISGIKPKDGSQRSLWLYSLRSGKITTKGTNPQISYFYKHKTGQLYCYPYRDYLYKELPENIINQLKRKYPLLSHSGCKICPVLVLFQNRLGIKKEKRLQPSLLYWEQLQKEKHYDLKLIQEKIN